MILSFLALVAISAFPPALPGVERSSVVADGSGEVLAKGSLRIDREDQAALWVSPGEVLEFQVELDLGVLGETGLGSVVMSSGVEPFVSGLPLPGQSLGNGAKKVGWVKIRAFGEQLGYRLDHTISTRFLPQVWPNSINSEVQSGSENRKREIKLGEKKGKTLSEYRANGHCMDCERREHFVIASLPWNTDYHCRRCKRGEHRIWRKPTTREVPPNTLDILGTVYLARTLVRSGVQELKTSMVQKNDLWAVTLRLGREENISVEAGTFPCREVLLIVDLPEGEVDTKRKFSGLFGIRGALKIWMHSASGVPILIEGDVPVGDIMDLHAKIGLAKYLGTPKALQPLKP
jgi:hypothetical protein